MLFAHTLCAIKAQNYLNLVDFPNFNVVGELQISRPPKGQILNDSLPILTLRRLFPPNPDSSTLLIVCGRHDYSASMIARAVEDCDAHLLNLNILADTPDAESVAVAIRVGLRHAPSVIRSLARYGYEATEIDAEAVTGLHPSYQTAD